MSLIINKMHLPESCYSKRLRLVEGLVIHFFSAYYVAPGMWSSVLKCHDLLVKLGFSYDWMIARNGRIWEFTPAGRTSWHAGNSMHRGRPYCNSWMAGVALIAAPQVLPDYDYTDAQYETLNALIKEKGWPSDMITGHQAVREEYLYTHKADKKTVRKRDPGPTFDWNRIGVQRCVL